MNDDDCTLLEHIAAGDIKAMNAFFNRHQHRVYAFALRRLNDPADAADVLNDVMLQVWQGAGRFANHSKVTTWLLAIANHKILDIYRKRGRNLYEELDENIADEGNDPPLLDILRAQHSTLLARCLDKLPDRQRQVVHLAFYEDMSYQDIAATVNCPTGTVKTRMMHAKEKLKRCLQASTLAI